MIYAMELKNSPKFFKIEVGENNDQLGFGSRQKSWSYWFYNGHFIAVGLVFFHRISWVWCTMRDVALRHSNSCIVKPFDDKS